MARPTRRKISQYVASQVASGNGAAALREAAAELVASSQVKDAELLVNDIEKALAGHGVTVADVYSANPLAKSAREQVIKYITNAESAKKVVLREHVDATLLGGLRLEVAGKELDVSLQRKITALKAQKI